jgi:excisionase family DNA binding protein
VVVSVPDRWITIGELAERLSVSIACIRGWIRRGTLPSSCYLQVGGAYRFDFDAIVQEFRGRRSDRPHSEESPPEQLELDFGEEHQVIRNHNPAKN